MTLRRSLILFGLLGWTLSSLASTTITYSADDTTNFCNPERGFYEHFEQEVTSEGKTLLKKSKLTSVRESGRTLLLMLYYFNNFRATDLPTAVLNQIKEDFTLLRQNGCKAILRFAYSNNNNWPYQDASPTIWKRHLEQLKPILTDNADVIAVVQAGFLGIWGEWYYSSQGTGDDIPESVKKDLIDQLLDAVPASRAVQLRTPDYKRNYLNNNSALPASEAYNGTARARLGHHNDAFLYGKTNMGTYSNRETDMAYLAQECLYLPNGGESDITQDNDDGIYQNWGTGEKAKVEMAKLHFSYLNQEYSEYVINNWKKEGAFDEIARNMGYRFQLVSGTYPDSVAPGNQMKITLKIKNVGYATPYNERHAYIVLKNNEHTYSFKLVSDPRLWSPNGVITTITENVTIPKSVVEGTYQLFLHLPDAASSLATKSEYAIRLANMDVWDANTGYNNLKKSIHITHTTPIIPDSGTIIVPAILSKENVAETHPDMTYAFGEYFDFGPNDSSNDLTLWADWNVNIPTSGKYIISSTTYSTNGWRLELQLMDNDDIISIFDADSLYITGQQDNIKLGTWDLSTIASGEYTIRLKNIMPWSAVKVFSISLDKEGQIPSSIVEETKCISRPTKMLHNNQLYIYSNGQYYTPWGLHLSTDNY